MRLARISLAVGVALLRPSLPLPGPLRRRPARAGNSATHEALPPNELSGWTRRRRNSAKPAHGSRRFSEAESRATQR